MLRHSVIFYSLWTCLHGTSLAEHTFKEHGFTFTYPPSEKVTVVGKKTKTIRVENAHDASFIIQNHGDTISPEALKDLMLKKLVEQLGDSASPLKHRTSHRLLFGKPREGTHILYTQRNNIPKEALLFIFKHQSDTICVITQTSLQYSKEAEAMFARIQNTLKISP